MSEWIACKDKMPPQGETVLAYWPKTSLLEWIDRASWIPSRGWVCYGYSGEEQPTHWMPLPPPPSQEKDK